jgi:hypothetical protein
MDTGFSGSVFRFRSSAQQSQTSSRRPVSIEHRDGPHTVIWT